MIARISDFVDSYLASPGGGHLLFPSSISSVFSAAVIRQYFQANVSFQPRWTCFQLIDDVQWAGRVLKTFQELGDNRFLILGFHSPVELPAGAEALQVFGDKEQGFFLQPSGEGPQRLDIASLPQSLEIIAPKLGAENAMKLALPLLEDFRQRLALFDLIHLEFFSGGVDKAMNSLSRGAVDQAELEVLKYWRERFSQFSSSLLRAVPGHSAEGDLLRIQLEKLSGDNDVGLGFSCHALSRAVAGADSKRVQFRCLLRSEVPLVSRTELVEFNSEDEEAACHYREEFGPFSGRLSVIPQEF